MKMTSPDEVLKTDEKRGKSKKTPPKKRSNESGKSLEELLPKGNSFKRKMNEKSKILQPF